MRDFLMWEEFEADCDTMADWMERYFILKKIEYFYIFSDGLLVDKVKFNKENKLEKLEEAKEIAQQHYREKELKRKG